MKIGGFSNEYTLALEIEEGRITNVGWTTYVYLAALIILAIIGYGIQIGSVDLEVFKKEDYFYPNKDKDSDESYYSEDDDSERVSLRRSDIQGRRYME